MTAWPQFEKRLESRSRFARVLDRIGSHQFKNGIYILLYHGLVRGDASDWEASYERVMTPLDLMKDHIEFLTNQGFRPVKLSDAPRLFKNGIVTDKYFIVTFDDGYSNLMGAADFFSKQKIFPTVFANGAFCEGAPYFRVMAAMLCRHEYHRQLQAALSKRAPHINWPDDPKALFNALKDFYVPSTTEEVVVDVYKANLGNPSLLKCHLSVTDLDDLTRLGWEIGNHTWDHKTLSSLSRADIVSSIERNASFFHDRNIDLIDWLAYPNGLSKHVNPAVKTWLDDNSHINGAFAGGGVNLVPTRTQWLRIPLWRETIPQLKNTLLMNLRSTLRLLSDSNYPSAMNY